MIEPADPAGMIEDVLQRAKSAAALLAGKVDEGDAGAYKLWLLEIADHVVTAASSGGFLGIGGETVSESERRFRDELSHVLND